jgi:hypothetical protein
VKPFIVPVHTTSSWELSGIICEEVWTEFKSPAYPAHLVLAGQDVPAVFTDGYPHLGAFSHLGNRAAVTATLVEGHPVQKSHVVLEKRGDA